MDRRPMRYAHAEGHTEIAYTGNGDEIVTCGSDGDVRVWAGLEDDDPRSVCVGEWALALSVTSSHLFVSTDNHNVQKYTFPAFDKDGIVARFTAPVTQIALCEKVSKIACCSENMEAKFCSLEDKSISGIMAHEGPVLSISVCPTGKYSATSSGDGYCRIWNLEDNSVIKQMHCIPKSNSFYSAKVLGRTSFEPKSGKYLAYPSNREVIILDTKTWQQKFSLNHPKIKCSVSQCLFSPCGNYLAASTVAGQIVVWNMNTTSALGITEHPTSHNVSSMAWNPNGSGEIAFCDVSGQLGTIIDCFGARPSKKTEEDDENLDLMEIIERENEDSNQEVINYEDNDADEDGENVISLNKLKNETLKAEDEDAGSEAGSGMKRSRSRSRSISRERRMQPQPPMQPSATPVHLEHRYMCWNDVGMVRCHTTESESSIEVEFHDANVHHSIHLNNHLNHTLAALSSTVLVLACEAPSKLVCIALVGGSKEWSMSMPDLEEVQCVTATDTLVAAATSSRYLRLFTPLGTQLHAVCLLGSPVSLTGRGGILHALYHVADPGVSDQQIAMDTIQVQGMEPRVISSNVRVPLSAGSLLRWAGSTERGTAATMDSVGVVRMYQHRARLWLPVCESQNHARGASDTYYIISISEESECVRAVLCRGSPYPLTAPRPTVTQLPLQLPFCELDTEKSQYEEQLRRLAILGSGDSSSSKLEIALKLFALACRSEVEQRASELMEILQEKKAIAPAARYASRLGKLHLADRLTSIANDWENTIEEDLVDTSTQQPMDNTESEDLDASLIIPQNKQKEEIVPLKPAPLRTFGARNPFRKSSSVSDNCSAEKPRPLSLTDRQLVTPDSTPKSEPKPFSAKIVPSETFVQWYGRNKENLQEEHASLNAVELTKMGMKTFKALLQQNSNADTTPKRKLSPTKDDKNSESAKQSKLSRKGSDDSSETVKSSTKQSKNLKITDDSNTPKVTSKQSKISDFQKRTI